MGSRNVQGELFAPRKKRRRTPGVRWGRPPKNPHRSSERHQRRADFPPRFPIHVTCRIERDVGSLRRPHAYRAIRKAMQRTLGRTDFRIVHISLERDHLHLIVEADGKRALWTGMQVFQIWAARLLNQEISKQRRRQRRGRVFCDRYHPVVIENPTQAHRALAYVLNNWRRHKQDQGAEEMFWDVDRYSSGASFLGWAELDDASRGPPRFDDDHDDWPPLPVVSPETWLLSVGWRRAGRISMHGVPGPRPAQPL